MLTLELKNVLDLVLKGHNVYIGGLAGTGKSFYSHIFDSLIKQGKQVSVMGTTGIAYTHFQGRCCAVTLHSWSGMDDGRYESEQICKLQNSVKYKHALRCILTIDVLLVDEVSMLSKTLFEQLSHICSLKNKNHLFGNIQLVFVDFVHLPLVQNENGKFCFQVIF